MLLAVSYDGALKMWDNKLQLVSAVKAAHDGARVHCLAIGPDGNLYTGGDDKVCWPAMVAGHSARSRILQRQLACVRRGQRCGPSTKSCSSRTLSDVPAAHAPVCFVTSSISASAIFMLAC